MKKYCVKCGKPFEATGREVICPACKESAKAEAKREAVMRAKRASWTGESVPVRISGRASTVIRAYAAEKSLSFAAALDELLKSTDYFKGTGKVWEDIVPYKSHRRDRNATEDVPQDKPVKTAAKATSKATTSTAKVASKTAKKAVKTEAKATKATKAADSTALAELFLSGAE